MTIEALYKRIIASDELKSAFIEAVKAQKLDEFLKSQGCDAAGAEIMDFLKSLQKAEGELADDELNSVAGGCNGGEAAVSILGFGFMCGMMAMKSSRESPLPKDEWPDGNILCYLG